MKTERLKKKKAISPVISALILTATVLSIGGGIWFYSQGAMTITSEDYAESVINMTDTISERFIIEHVYYKYVYYDEEVGYVPELHVFVYNYGSVDIEVKVEVKDIDYPVDEKVWIKIPSKEMMPFPIIDLGTPPGSDDELNIKVYTRRENSVYYRYLVP